MLSTIWSKKPDAGGLSEFASREGYTTPNGPLLPKDSGGFFNGKGDHIRH
jgi:hypothetical protein